jgi:hypothetical protein
MRAPASFCVAAGADPDLILQRVAEGRHRAATAGKPPFSNPARHSPRRPRARRPGIGGTPGRGQDHPLIAARSG